MAVPITMLPAAHTANIITLYWIGQTISEQSSNLLVMDSLRTIVRPPFLLDTCYTSFLYRCGRRAWTAAKSRWLSRGWQIIEHDNDNQTVLFIKLGMKASSIVTKAV